MTIPGTDTPFGAGPRPERAAVDLYWLPLGAGGHFVRLSGRVFEAVAARAARRPACDLYHSALEVRAAAARFVIEQAPVPDARGEQRGVVAEGPVGSRWAGRFRIFRYEIRRWRDGRIPDVNVAVGSPWRLTDDDPRAQRVLDLLPQVPTPGLGPRRAQDRRHVELELGHRLADRAQRDRHRVDPPSDSRTCAGMAGRARGCATTGSGDAARALALLMRTSSPARNASFSERSRTKE